VPKFSAGSSLKTAVKSGGGVAGTFGAGPPTDEALEALPREPGVPWDDEED
jgi:hypothetical protein